MKNGLSIYRKIFLDYNKEFSNHILIRMLKYTMEGSMNKTDELPRDLVMMIPISAGLHETHMCMVVRIPWL
jgi:hypothetical protein